MSWRGPRLRRRWSGLSGLKSAEGKAAEESTLDWGFLPQQRDCHKTAFHSSRGLVLLRFQVFFWSAVHGKWTHLHGNTEEKQKTGAWIDSTWSGINGLPSFWKTVAMELGRIKWWLTEKNKGKMAKCWRHRKASRCAEARRERSLYRDQILLQSTWLHAVAKN